VLGASHEKASLTFISCSLPISLTNRRRVFSIPNANDYDLNFRPNSYWGAQELGAYYGSRIKGELRRQMVVTAIDKGGIPEKMLDSELNNNIKRAIGQIHPWNMGGEYLPDLFPNEVEIARVILKSTTMDVISIRARHTKHRIIYRIVDEYEPEYWDFELTKKTSARPLTMREIISLIDLSREGGLVGSGRDYHFDEYGSDPEEIYDFETAASAFYPELEAWYDAVNEEWLEAKSCKIAEEPKTPEKRIKAWIKRAEFSQPEVRSSLANAGFAAAATMLLIKNYVQAYFEKTGSLPTGKHEIHEILVEFPADVKPD